jgi:hypothetical protein
LPAKYTGSYDFLNIQGDQSVSNYKDEEKDFFCSQSDLSSKPRFLKRQEMVVAQSLRRINSLERTGKKSILQKSNEILSNSGDNKVSVVNHDIFQTRSLIRVRGTLSIVQQG